MLQQLPQGARVLVIRLRSLGDCVLTTPALRLLHEFRPDLSTAVMVEPRFESVYTGNPAVAEILKPSAAAAAAFRPELCVNLHGGTRSLALIAASRARWRAGYAHLRGQWLYNLSIPRAQEILGEEGTVHTAEHVASAFFWLGVPREEIPRAQLFAAAPVQRSPYAVFHPFASTPEKTWPADRFLALARRLREHARLETVFVGADSDNWEPFSDVETVQGASLEHLKNLLAGAALFVGNDSGPAHMAAAFGSPAVVIFGPSDSAIWAPWRTQAETLVGGDSAANVTLDQALASLDRLMVRA